jgi:hypothetical protein
MTVIAELCDDAEIKILSASEARSANVEVRVSSCSLIGVKLVSTLLLH